MQHGQRIFRLRLKKTLQLGDGLIDAIVVGQQQGMRANGQRRAGLELQQPLGIGQRVGLVALVLVGAGPRQQQPDIAGIDGQARFRSSMAASSLPCWLWMWAFSNNGSTDSGLSFRALSRAASASS